MTDADWEVGYAKSLGVFLNGSSLPEPDRHGRQVADSSFYLLFNAWEEPLQFRLPARNGEVRGGSRSTHRTSGP